MNTKLHWSDLTFTVQSGLVLTVFEMEREQVDTWRQRPEDISPDLCAWILPNCAQDYVELCHQVDAMDDGVNPLTPEQFNYRQRLMEDASSRRDTHTLSPHEVDWSGYRNVLQHGHWSRSIHRKCAELLKVSVNDSLGKSDHTVYRELVAKLSVHHELVEAALEADERRRPEVPSQDG